MARCGAGMLVWVRLFIAPLYSSRWSMRAVTPILSRRSLRKGVCSTAPASGQAAGGLHPDLAGRRRQDIAAVGLSAFVEAFGEGDHRLAGAPEAGDLVGELLGMDEIDPGIAQAQQQEPDPAIRRRGIEAAQRILEGHGPLQGDTGEGAVRQGIDDPIAEVEDQHGLRRRGRRRQPGQMVAPPSRPSRPGRPSARRGWRAGRGGSCR